MNFIYLTQENARSYIGYDIIFNHDIPGTKRRVCRQILKVSKSRKTIYIDYPALDNKLQLVDFSHIEVILDKEAELMKQLEEIRRRKEEHRLEVINKMREKHRNQILAKIRYLEYELESFDNISNEEFIIGKF